MSHDAHCISANRFGDGFDCVCEPDWKAIAARGRKLLEAASVSGVSPDLKLAIEAYLRAGR